MNKFKKMSKRGIAIVGVLVLMMCMSISAFADGPVLLEESGITTAVTTALNTVQSDAMSLIAAVLPYALAIMGSIIVVTIGIRAFKRTSK